MAFSRQESWSRLPFPPSGDLPNPEIEPMSLALQADPSPAEPLGNYFYFKDKDIQSQANNSTANKLWKLYLKTSLRDSMVHALF